MKTVRVFFQSIIGLVFGVISSVALTPLFASITDGKGSVGFFVVALVGAVLAGGLHQLCDEHSGEAFYCLEQQSLHFQYPHLFFQASFRMLWSQVPQKPIRGTQRREA